MKIRMFSVLIKINRKIVLGWHVYETVNISPLLSNCLMFSMIHLKFII